MAMSDVTTLRMAHSFRLNVGARAACEMNNWQESITSSIGGLTLLHGIILTRFVFSKLG